MTECLVVDDHPLWRQVLVNVIASNFPGKVHEAASLDEARAVVNERGPLLVLADLTLPDGSGEELIGQAHVVIVSADERPSSVGRCLRKGASGYIPKSTPAEALVTAVRRVLAGGVGIPETLRASLEEHRRSQPVIVLTPREWEVLTLLRQGVTSTRDLARSMFVTERTIKAHLGSIYSKSGLCDRAGIMVEDSKGRFATSD